MGAALTRTVCSLLVIAGIASGSRSVPADRAGDDVSSFSQAAASQITRARLVEQGFQRLSERRVYRVTAYCDRGTTAAGISSGLGQCAAPADVPFGSIVYIPSLDRTLVVTDRTHKRFRHNTVDIFMPGRDQCLQFGRKYLECEIYLPSKRPRYGSPRFGQLLASIRG
jgi:3D (Asp-Asp-Asp) domain-containing protein